MKGTISLGDQEKSKDRKVGVKSGGFWFSLPIPPKKTGGSHPGWNHVTREIDHLTQRRTQGPGIVKGWEDNRDRGRIPDAFT